MEKKQSTFKALQLNQFNPCNNQIIQTQQFDGSQLKDGEFIAKMHASPINPLDIQKISGKMINVSLPFIPGSECSATITECNDSILIGKKVAMVVQEGSGGAWQEYVKGSIKNAIVQNDDADLDTISCGFVNPLTCLGLVEQATKKKAKAIVNLAATSQLGRMIHRVAKEKGLEVINVVRSQQNVELLKKIHQTDKYILDLHDSNFDVQFKELSDKLQATVCFDPVGGSLTGVVFNNMPPNSKVIVYGSLSGQDISGINGVQVRWANKTLKGFVMFRWLSSKSDQERLQCYNFIKEHINTLFKSTIQGIYTFDQFDKAFDTCVNNLSKGKILLKFQ